MVPTWAYIQGVLKVKVKVKGHVIRTLLDCILACMSNEDEENCGRLMELEDDE